MQICRCANKKWLLKLNNPVKTGLFGQNENVQLEPMYSTCTFAHFHICTFMYRLSVFLHTAASAGPNIFSYPFATITDIT